MNRNINHQELAGLQALLGVIRAVANHDDVIRIALCEHAIWKPLDTMRGLVQCSIDLSLKMDLLLTLDALDKSNETTLPLWEKNEARQSITTIPSTNTISSVLHDINRKSIIFDSGGMEQTKCQKPSLKNGTQVKKATDVVSYC